MTIDGRIQQPGPEAYYEALVSRDARFDGRFFVGVSSTGIYCRPICPAPKPKPQNCTYYRSAAEAEQRGFRPCKRCRPETAPSSAAWAGTSTTVRRAVRLIAEGALDDASVDDLADRLGVGSRHLRRLFEKHLGASPTALALTQRLHLAVQLLHNTSLSITDIAIASGFGSLRRFNSAFKTSYGEPPSAFRKKSETRRRVTPITIAMSFVPPYDADAMFGFLRTRAVPGVEHVTATTYSRTFSVAGFRGTVHVSAEPESNRLVAEIRASDVGPLLPVVERVRALFDIDADPNAVNAVLGSPGGSGIWSGLEGVRVPGGWDFFEIGVRAILGQQVTVKGARTIAHRLTLAYGEALPTLDGASPELTHLFPTPEALAKAEIEKHGVPGQRAEAVRAFSRAVVDGRLGDGSMASGDAMDEQLCALPGVGPWTAAYIRMRGMKDPDAFLRGDVALLKAARQAGLADSPAELEKAMESFRPWRAYAAVRLWKKLA